MRRALVFLVLVTIVCGAALGGPAAPKYRFLVRMPTAGGSYYWRTPDNGATVTAYPAGKDTTGAGKAAAYPGDQVYYWLFIPDSTNTYDFYETGGDPDSLIATGEAVALMGPELVVADSAVTASSLREDPDGRFRPSTPFEFTPACTLFTRHIYPDTLGTAIRFGASVEIDDTLRVSRVEPDSSGLDLTLGGHVRADSVTVDTLLATVDLSVSDAATVGSLTSDGEIIATSFVDADSVHARAGAFDDSLRVGTGGVGDGFKVRGGATVTGTTSLVTLTTTGSVTVGDGKGTDSLSVRGDMRARGGEVFAGTAGQVGKVEVSDGSSNKTSLTGTAWGSDVTLNLPFFFADFHTQSKARCAYYVAGIDTSWVAIPVRDLVYDPGGASESEDAPVVGSRPIYTTCKTDSIIVRFYASTYPHDDLNRILLLVGKKNLWRR